MIIIKAGLRRIIAAAHDFLAIIIAWWLAYQLRYDFQVSVEQQAALGNTLLLILPVQAGIFFLFRLYRGLWRYASLPDLKQIFFSVTLGTAIAAAIILPFKLPNMAPPVVLLLAPMLLLLIMGGSRFAYRTWKEQRKQNLQDIQRQSTIVLGSGNAAANLIKELERSHDWHVIGVLTDKESKLGANLHGVRVLGMINELPGWVEKFNIGHVIIAMPFASKELRRSALEICASIDIKPMIIPSYIDLVSRKMTVSPVRNIDLGDLLGREPVVLDTQGLHELLTGKVILVTGAGGSIGAELCRQVLTFNPGLLIALELNEYTLYVIKEIFRAEFPAIPMAFLIGDVKNRARLDQIFEKYRPDVVFHAAAYKHVPLMEQDNAWQAVQNNVVGTYVLANAAIRHNVEKFVFISTDKAVNPTNIMGASKRLGEMICQALQQSSSKTQQQSRRHTQFVIVRFGNVLGSTGSVIPKFKEQIARGGPVTVTHPEISRYFMSLQEAAQLVLQAGAMQGSELGGDIFIMDMGEPVKIVDLAKDMIRMSGLHEEDIKIIFTGLRPGEKLHEELARENEYTLPTAHEKLRITHSRFIDEQWLDRLVTWFGEQSALTDEATKLELAEWVPEYRRQSGNYSVELHESAVITDQPGTEERV
ncbi:MAG: nucleoside-diphosphate sugar epimerase/dehydratase [Nitrosomonas sp.]|nr:nucleoside-diphosphate sugar epimerase/dehydratase [Nitrosomonas sp.]